MSVQLYDVDGYVGDLATNTGMLNLNDFIMEKGNNASKGLMVLGSSLVTNDLIINLKSLKPRNPHVKDTLNNLIKMIKKSELVVIIADGVR